MNNVVTYEMMLSRIKNYLPKGEIIDLIEKAYTFAKEKQENIKRIDDSTLLSHSVAVAYILADLNVDHITIISALLHESINAGTTTVEEIRSLFGDEVALITENVSKINKLVLNDDSESSSVYLRKVLVGLSEDVRVLFIKLADRLHNMETIYYIKNDIQKQKLLDTKNVLIPIAHRLGINSIKSKLEDLWLKHSKPDIYNDIVEKLNADKEELNILIDEMIQSISEILFTHDLRFEIKGRVKSVHSIYEKLLTGRKFSDIYDILALRLIFEKESDCYLAVGHIHAKYRPVQKRFKDYIAMPKENMYQSLHTTVFGVNSYLFEIQLRTKEMDEIAEHGLASHWSYKEKGTLKSQNFMEHKLEIFRNLVENKENIGDTEFDNQIESELLTEMIYVYTPKGDVIELPFDSTPIDFAYKIHSKVGDSMIGCIVNETIAPLNHPLSDGDIVNIKTSASSKPKKEWLNMAKTAQAKSKIKSYFSKQDKDTYLIRGKEILDKESRRLKIVQSEVFNEANMKKIITTLKLSDWDEVLFNIGSLRTTVKGLLNIINNDSKSSQEELIDKVMNNNKERKEEYRNEIIVAGIDDIKVNLASCCNPVFGDDIKGYITKGKGIMVHRSSCANIKNITERIIDVEWNDKQEKLYYSNLLVTTTSGSNPIIDIVTKATIRNIQVESFNTVNSNNNLNYILVVKTKNSNDLDNFIDDLINLKDVITVKRGTTA